MTQHNHVLYICQYLMFFIPTKLRVLVAKIVAIASNSYVEGFPEFYTTLCVHDPAYNNGDLSFAVSVSCLIITV